MTIAWPESRVLLSAWVEGAVRANGLIPAKIWGF